MYVIVRWILDQQCSGSRDFMGGVHAALENDEEAKHNVGKLTRPHKNRETAQKKDLH